MEYRGAEGKIERVVGFGEIGANDVQLKDQLANRRDGLVIR